MTEHGRFEIRAVNEHDPNEVYGWCFRTCRNQDLKFLADFHEARRPDREAVVVALVRGFPQAVREAGRRGCMDGFRAGDEDAGLSLSD